MTQKRARAYAQNSAHDVVVEKTHVTEPLCRTTHRRSKNTHMHIKYPENRHPTMILSATPGADDRGEGQGRVFTFQLALVDC